MIAVSENSGFTVALYKTLRGYMGGNTDPVDFAHVEPGQKTDDALATLGFTRVEDWKRPPAEQFYPDNPKAVAAFAGSYIAGVEAA